MTARRLIAKQAREWPEKLGNDMTAFRSNLLSTIQVDRLSNLSEDMGVITSGEFRVGNGVEPDSGFTGGRMAWPQMTYGGSNFFLVGVANDVLQIGLSLDDGKLYGAEGSVIISATGITLKVGNAIIWQDDNLTGFKMSYSGTGASQQMDIVAQGINITKPDATITIQAANCGLGQNAKFSLRTKTGSAKNYAYLWGSSGTFTGFTVGADLLPTAMLDIRGGIKSSASIAINDNINASGTLTVSNTFTAGASRAMVQASAFLNLQQSGTLVINAGSITATGTRHLVDGSGAATQTDLEGVNGLNDGDLIILRTVANARDVNLRHNTTNGNLILNNNVDRILGLRNDMFVGMYQTNTCKVLEWGRIG